MVSILSPIVDRIYGGGPLYGDALFGGGLSSIAPSGNFAPEIGTPYAQHLLGGGMPVFGRGRYGGSGLLTGGSGGMGGIFQSIFGNDPVLQNLIGAALSFRPQFQSPGEEESPPQSGDGGSAATDSAPTTKDDDQKTPGATDKKPPKKGRGKATGTIDIAAKRKVELEKEKTKIKTRLETISTELGEIKKRIESFKADIRHAIKYDYIPGENKIGVGSETYLDLKDPQTVQDYPDHFPSLEAMKSLDKEISQMGGEVIVSEQDQNLYLLLLGDDVLEAHLDASNEWTFNVAGVLDKNTLYKDPVIQDLVQQIQVGHVEKGRLEVEKENLSKQLKSLEGSSTSEMGPGG